MTLKTQRGRGGVGLVGPEPHILLKSLLRRKATKKKKNTCRDTLLELHPGAQVSKMTRAEGPCFEVVSSSSDRANLK